MSEHITPTAGVPTIYSMTISESDVGTRIMVRRTIPEGVTDVVGDLVEWTGESLTILTRRGPVVVPLDSIIAGKRIPPAVTRKIHARRTDE